MIVADTGAIIALIDADDRHHHAVRELFEDDPAAWVLPWSILAEVDYLLGAHVSSQAQRAFLDDLAAGAFIVEWGDETDLVRARILSAQYPSLKLGLVDATVMAVAERLEADAIATLDRRDFGPVQLSGSPRLLP